MASPSPISSNCNNSSSHDKNLDLEDGNHNRNSKGDNEFMNSDGEYEFNENDGSKMFRRVQSSLLSMMKRHGRQKNDVDKKWEAFLHSVNRNGKNADKYTNDGNMDDNDNGNGSNVIKADASANAILATSPAATTATTITAPKVCAICLEEYTAGDEVCLSYNKDCHHVFHKDCM